MKRLELVAEEGKGVTWGVFKDTDSNDYILTNIHGSVNGYLSIEWQGKVMSTEPQTLRMDLYELSGVYIDNNNTVIITPCHPAAVKRTNNRQLKHCNIEVVGDWEDQTVSYLSVGGKLIVANSELLNKNKALRNSNDLVQFELEKETLLDRQNKEEYMFAVQTLLKQIENNTEIESELLESGVYQFWITVEWGNCKFRDFAVIVNINTIANLDDYKNYQVTVLRINKDESFEDISNKEKNYYKVNTTSLMLREKVRELLNKGCLVK